MNMNYSQQPMNNTTISKDTGESSIALNDPQATPFYYPHQTQTQPGSVVVGMSNYPQQPPQTMYIQPQGQPVQQVYMTTSNLPPGTTAVYYQPTMPGQPYVVQSATVPTTSNITTQQPTVMATTTTSLPTGVNVSSSFSTPEGSQAQNAFNTALLVSMLMWFFGIGFCFSCFFWIPVLKYKKSNDATARRYGTYGQYGFVITTVLNVITFIFIIIPIIVAVAITSSYRRR
ncbi:hypothetical protein C9374_008261 [Naegleria lovaniensis]|uniref:Uncharacterized protein n=1 Tax=Naegleria lovaniensis TaxID=51637 RepID=A0AA88GFQ9_NAELO|nr:uncharacterized protein C9374_008261 [Naegleria lovaniensis]KAG2378622.1 hypothetical protein C9374_008261 [Naegleria lovaniensis]